MRYQAALRPDMSSKIDSRVHFSFVVLQRAIRPHAIGFRATARRVYLCPRVPSYPPFCCHGKAQHPATGQKETKMRFRVRAARHGRPMEHEAKEILRMSFTEGPRRKLNLAESIRRRFTSLGGVQIELACRDETREAPNLPRHKHRSD